MPRLMGVLGCLELKSDLRSSAFLSYKHYGPEPLAVSLWLSQNLTSCTYICYMIYMFFNILTFEHRAWHNKYTF